MEFTDPSPDLIDLLQYATVYQMTVDWLPGVPRFMPMNLDIRREYDHLTFNTISTVHRRVRVDGIASP